MDARWEQIAQPLHRERTLMRDDTASVGPQPRDDEVFALAGGELDEAVDAAAHTCEPTTTQVVSDQLLRVPGVRGLLRREEPLLGHRGLEQAARVGMG